MKSDEHHAQLDSLEAKATSSLSDSSGRPKTVLIFEMDHKGHHLRYVSLIVEAFRSVGVNVVLASTQTAFQSAEYSALMRSADAHVRKLLIPQRLRFGRLRDLEHVCRLLGLLARAEADLYFVPFLGTIYSKFGLLGMFLRLLGFKMPPVWGILLTWTFAYKGLGAANRRSWREKLWQTILQHGPFEKVFIVDEIAFDYTTKHYNTARLLFSPEPIVRSPTGDSRAFREVIRIPLGAKVIGVFGALRRSRGAQYLLEAFLRREAREDQYLLLMGPQDTEIKNDFTQILQKYPKHPQVIMIERFLSESELQEAFSGVDIIAVPYPNYCSTPTMLLRAAAAGKPVLGANDGWIGSIMSKYRLGLSCDVRNVTDLMAALDKALGTPGIVCPDARVLADRYACERFSHAITNSFEATSGYQ